MLISRKTLQVRCELRSLFDHLKRYVHSLHNSVEITDLFERTNRKWIAPTFIGATSQMLSYNTQNYCCN